MIASILKECIADLEIEVPDSCVSDLERFAIELKKWNKKVNLTAIAADDEVAIKHLMDSLMVSRWISGAKKVLDIGSGAGVPAIPLKICLPDTHIVSVDSVGKKILFQRHAARMLGLRGFEAIHARVESLHESHAGYYDLIISRAFSRLDTFVSLAAPLLAEGGVIAAMKGPAAEEEILGGGDVIKDRGFVISESHTYFLPRNKGERRLVMISSAEGP